MREHPSLHVSRLCHTAVNACKRKKETINNKIIRFFRRKHVSHDSEFSERRIVQFENFITWLKLNLFGDDTEVYNAIMS